MQCKAHTVRVSTLQLPPAAPPSPPLPRRPCAASAVQSLYFVVQTNASAAFFKNRFQDPNTYIALPLQVRRTAQYSTGRCRTCVPTSGSRARKRLSVGAFHCFQTLHPASGWLACQQHAKKNAARACCLFPGVRLRGPSPHRHLLHLTRNWFQALQ